MKYIKQVQEFMAIMGQELPEKPIIPSGKIQELRHELIQEENKELSDAAAVANLVEIADALCDLRYVTEGASLAYGFSPELMDELFEEVHASNMSKVCKSEQEAIETSNYYHRQSPPIPVYREKHGDFWVIARLSDRKVLKSINWREPNLKTILERHGVKC